MKKITIQILLLIIPFSILAQTGNKVTQLNREVTLYNPFKPTLQEAGKKSYLPDMSDTIRISPVFRYEIISRPFMPVYNISPIKSASLLPDPLPKLYRSYLNAGFGNYVSPLAEISITSGRSKKGAVGIYAKHFSSNGKVKLDNNIRVFAGYMDNEASVFGKKFMKKSIIESSVDFNQFTRYAYGYDTSMINYDPSKKEIKFNYLNTGAKINLYSTNTDSSELSYNLGFKYDYFYQNSSFWEHNFELKGAGAIMYKGFYAGTGFDINIFKLSPELNDNLRNIISVSPFISKSTSLWNFKAGIQILTETSQDNLLRNPTQEDYKTRFHLYPDFNFGFNIVPTYVNFFARLSGELENNQPLKIIDENPFIIPDGILYNLPNTDRELIVNAGLKGNTGTEGSYILSASYSIINDLILFKNYHLSLAGSPFTETGNLFLPEVDNAEMLNIHGELLNNFTDKISILFAGNYYKYTLTSEDFAWNKPEWDARVAVKYNLREKILAGAELSAEGLRKASFLSGAGLSVERAINLPSQISLNLNAEYRYTKILSFWVRLNNISFSRYNEWLFYPTMRFMGMAGFTYSL